MIRARLSLTRTRVTTRGHGERTLLPGDDAQLGETRFETWLTQSAAKAAAVTH